MSSNLALLSDSVEKTLRRLRDKHGFLHQHQRYYSDVRKRLLEMKTGTDEDDLEDSQELIVETGLEFNDIIISTKHRVFVDIGYEYFAEKSVEEAVQFAEEKLQLITDAIRQFDAKIEEAQLTKGRIEEMARLGDAPEENEEDDLPAMEIREELDDDGNVIRSSVTPSGGDQQTKKELEQVLMGQQQGDKDVLSDFEKNIKGKLLETGASKTSPHPSVNKAEQETLQPPAIDTENMYTFEDLVRKMDEQDEMEAQMCDDEYLQSEEEEEEEDDNEETYVGMVPGAAARNAFEEQIRRLRRSKKAPLKSILRTKDKKRKPKKSVGFADAADVHEVESLKEENKNNTHNPLLQLGEDGTVLSKEQFDGDLFAKLIGVQGPDEIHEIYKDEVEREQEQETLKSRRKPISRFIQERRGAECREVVCDVIEKDADGPVEKPDPPVSDIVKKDIEEHIMFDIIEKGTNSSAFSKPLKSLRKPRKKPAPLPRIEFLDESDPEEEQSAPSQPTPEASHFPPEIQQAIRKNSQPVICRPTVDYLALGQNLDDMAKAYSLGLYEDDLDEDPGTLVEQLDDFKRYNTEVERLKDEIKDFQINNPMETNQERDFDSDSPVVTDVVEKELPPDYGGEDEIDDLALHPDKLSESIALDYRRLKESLLQSKFSNYTPKGKELEPIDQWGNPIRESRFRSQRFAPS